MKEESIIAYLSDDCSHEERDRVETWINDSPENKKYFDEMKFIWENAGTDFSGIHVDTGSSWRSIQEAVSKGSSRERGIRHLFSRSFMKIAASVVLLIGVGYLSIRVISTGRIFSSELVTVETTSQSSEVELPDGTRVWLNDNTTVSYPARFKTHSREIKLSGEAFFVVTKIKYRPFVVETDCARVEVLGTSFNVNSRGPGSKVLVSVVTGNVSFSEIGDLVNKIILEPGDQGTFSPLDGRLHKAKNTDDNFLAWKTGILVFRNTSLTEVCSILSDHYNQVVGIDNRDLLESKVLTATFDNKELEEVVNIIAVTLDLSFRHDGEQIILFPNN